MELKPFFLLIPFFSISIYVYIYSCVAIYRFEQNFVSIWICGMPNMYALWCKIGPKFDKLKNIIKFIQKQMIIRSVWSIWIRLIEGQHLSDQRIQYDNFNWLNQYLCHIQFKNQFNVPHSDIDFPSPSNMKIHQTIRIPSPQIDWLPFDTQINN